MNTSYTQVVQNMLLFIEQLLHCFITFKGGSLGGRADERTGEAEGDHGRTWADICRNVRILKVLLLFFQTNHSIQWN